MKQRNLARISRPFSDDETEAPDEMSAEKPADAAAETSEADYSFEGYSVDFIDKVALMPIAFTTQSRR
jgi:hypothetical protein